MCKNEKDLFGYTFVGVRGTNLTAHTMSYKRLLHKNFGNYKTTFHQLFGRIK
jgi:hypothetical protein